MSIRRFLEAGYPCLYSTTFETHRAIEFYLREVSEMNEEGDESEAYAVLRWDLDMGMVDLETGQVVDDAPSIIRGDRTNPIPVNSPLFPIKVLTGRGGNAIVFLPNFDIFLKGNVPDLNHAIINDYMNWKDEGKCMVVLAPTYNASPEIDRLFQLVDFPLPSEEYIKTLMTGVVPDDLVNPDHDPTDEDSKQFLVEFREDAIRSAKGMTSMEIENALSLSLIEKDEFDPLIISRIKQQQVKKSATLEISNKTHRFKDVIGLVHLKPYLLKVVMHPLAQGSLICGVQGCGKTYIAEAVANEIGVPALKLSFERMMAAGGGIVGQAQAQAIHTFKTIDAMSPAVVIADEIEKGLSGIQSSGRSDAGTKAGVGSIFLQWIENKTPGIYVVATCNSIEDLPPEYKRAGRWDTIIGVDLPTMEEIQANLEFYGEMYLDEDAYEEMVDDLESDDMKLLDDLDGYSHAELKTIIKQMAMLECNIRNAMQWVRPIGKVDPEKVKAIRDWIRKYAIMASEVREDIPALKKRAKDALIGRKIRRKKKRGIAA